MSHIYLVADRDEIARRRGQATGSLVEAWADLADPTHVWLSEESKAALDRLGPPLTCVLAIPERAIPVYYGPRLADLESLPSGASLRSRVLSVRGIAVAWATLDASGRRNEFQPASPADPTFHLRRPGTQRAHLWRLFRSRVDAVAWVAEYLLGDEEARQWAADLPASEFSDLVGRFGQRA